MCLACLASYNTVEFSLFSQLLSELGMSDFNQTFYTVTNRGSPKLSNTILSNHVIYIITAQGNCRSGHQLRNDLTYFLAFAGNGIFTIAVEYRAIKDFPPLDICAPIAVSACPPEPEN